MWKRTESVMTAKAFFDRIPVPPSAMLLGWHVLEARPNEGWIIGFEGKREFCNPAGFVQGGILPAISTTP
jgi:hypothetical protein